VLSGDCENGCTVHQFIGAGIIPAPRYYATSNRTSGSPSPSLALKRGGVGLGSISSQVLYLPIHFIQH
jgi:hypothetical protein